MATPAARRVAFCLVLSGVAAFSTPRVASAQPWADAGLAPDERAQLLLSAMTQDEKLAMVHGTGTGTYVGHVPGVPRLGIPDLNLEDGPAGVADGMTQVTAFPAPITIAATWDPALAQQFGAAVGAEQAGKGVNVVLAPMMNLDRVPAGGRNFEGFGEDPLLAARMASAVAKGIQSAGLVATAKHFIDNEQETLRMSISTTIDDRTQHEVYLPPFRACVAVGVGAVMCSFNQVNGVFACENEVAENGLLKGELGFQGWIMSDWGATHSAAPSALAGLDMEMPASDYFGSPLAAAVSSGQVPSSRLDDMVSRILRALFAAGLMDRAPAGSQGADVRTAATTATARDAAAQGTVLLKNDGALLPFDPSTVRSIAVIGPAGGASPVFQGGGSSRVTAANLVTPLQGISARAGSGTVVGYAAGSTAPFGDATALAARSDVAVVFVGVDSSEGSDRAGLSLPGGQDALVSAVAQANPRTVVVVYAPAQILMPWAGGVSAILFGGLPGQEEGSAIASVLFGDVNPSGKLPMTFATAEGDYPADTPAQFPGVRGIVAYTEGFLVGYRHFDSSAISPLFPFGHGLSYSTFQCTNLAVTPAVADGSNVSVALDVANVGPVAGAEVVELYVGLPPEASEPPLQLKDFQRIALSPGATQRVTFTLTPDAYSFWSAGRRGWAAYPGTHRVMLGASSRDIRLAAPFEVEGGPLAGVVLQAEDAALSCTAVVANDEPGYTGTGFVTGFTTAGTAAAFSVSVPVAGTCPVTARYSAANSPRTLSVYVNGSKAKTSTFPPLANLSVWDFETETLTLNAGLNTVRYVSDPGDTGEVVLDAIIACSGSGSDAGLAADGGGADGACAPLEASDPGSGARVRPQGFACGCTVGRRQRPNDGRTVSLLLALPVVLRISRRSRQGSWQRARGGSRRGGDRIANGVSSRKATRRRPAGLARR